MPAHGTCRCGAVWVQRGNRTGHCSACHETFEGIDAFDRHQHMLDMPPWQVCRQPERAINQDHEPVFEPAHVMVAGGASPYTWRVRVDEKTRQRLVYLAERQRSQRAEGDGLGNVDTPAEGGMLA